MLVTGEAGIGKTRLVSEVTDGAAAGGVGVFVGRCAELDRTRPFLPLAVALGCHSQATDVRAAAVARALSGHGSGLGATTVGSGPVEAAIVQALVEAVEALAFAGPVLLVVEDLHWADRSTLMTLRAIGTELADLPIAMVLTARSHPRDRDVDAFLAWLAGRRPTEVVLGPLDADAVAEVAADALARPAGAAVLGRLERAAGNPFFILELLGVLREQGMDDDAFAAADADGVALTATVRLTGLRRIGLLGGSTVELLRLASVLGSAFSVADLADVAERPVAALSADLDAALRASVLIEDGRQLRFRHDLVRDALYLDVPEAVRVAQHRDIARRLAETGADPQRVAAHFLIGAAKGDVVAAEFVHRAARQVAPVSPSGAADLLDRALAIVDGESDLADTIAVDLALLRLWSGDVGESEARARAVLTRHPRGLLAAEARRTLIDGLFLRGRWAEGADEARRALAADPSTAQRGHLLCCLAHGLMYAGDRPAATEAAVDAAVIATALGDDLIAGYAHWVRATLAQAAGDLAAAARYASEGLAASRRAGEVDQDERDLAPWAAAVALANQDIGFMLALLGSISLAAFDLGAARGYVGDAVVQFERLGGSVFLPEACGLAGSVRYLAAELDEAEPFFAAARQLREESRLPPFAQPAALHTLIHLHRGDMAEAATEASRLARAEHAAAPWLQVLVSAAGDDHDLDQVIARAWAATPLPALEFDEPWWWEIELLHAALAAGADAVVAGIVDIVDARAERLETEWATGYARHAAGLIAGDADTVADGMNRLRAPGADLLFAHAAEDAGLLYLAAGETARAKPLLAEAVEIYERASARHRQRRIVAAMRHAGLRANLRRTPARPATGWGALTLAEREVVALTTQGLTNPEIGTRLFISRRTVQTHLSHVYVKLGITSRVELATLAAAHPQPHR